MKYLFLILLCLTGCARPSDEDQPPKLSSITVIDNNGFTETTTSKERLQQYENVDFCNPQSYQKVLRVYGRNSQGNVVATLTSYHQNGQLKQLLNAKNNSAFGPYQEWFSSGQKKLEGTVISGTADLTPASEQTWLFDGLCQVWEENGSLAASIQYNKGFLDGTALYYHPSGNLWKRVPHNKGLIQGTVEIYLDDGQCLQTIQYDQDVKHGPSLRFWPDNSIASEELYQKGLLTNGLYFDKNGQEIATIQNGNGYRALFGIDAVSELQQYDHGVQEGEVKVFDPEGRIVNLYHIKDGLKHGEEIEYHENKFGTTTVKPKISLSWYQGILQGIVKTWYDNGTLESQREISNNKKNGLATAWYRDGSLMMIEEYEQDVLARGEYYKPGDKKPISQIWSGNGIAHLYNPEGTFIRKVNYHDGKPQE